MACEKSFNTENITEDPWGLYCSPKFDLAMNGDSEITESFITEPIELASAPINVFKLLGIHEQGKLVDLANNGRSISSSSLQGTSADNVFDQACGSWMSNERGKFVLDSFIGYDFGPMRQSSGTVKYADHSHVLHEIGTIKLIQSDKVNRRVSKVRIERSLNGGKWFGVSTVKLDTSTPENIIELSSSAPSRYWRIRPLEFNGISSGDVWEVKEVQMFNFNATKIDNLQDELGFMESRDRDYCLETIPMKMYYELFDAQTELSKYGIDMSNQSLFGQVSFRNAVKALGRPFVIGDIVEIPSEVQYTSNLEQVRKYMEVTDVAWSTDGYTPNWKPVLQRLILKPVFASQETMDIFPEVAIDDDKFGFVDEPSTREFVDPQNMHDRAKGSAETNVPERGFDVTEREYLSPERIEELNKTTVGDSSKVSYNPTELYVEDALPPNGEDYTEGDEYPTSPVDGQYHRLTYKEYNDNIPPRLYRYSEMKNRWIYYETDRRDEYTRFKPSIKGLINDHNTN